MPDRFLRYAAVIVRPLLTLGSYAERAEESLGWRRVQHSQEPYFPESNE